MGPSLSSSSTLVRKKKGNSSKAGRAGAVLKKSRIIGWGVQTWIEVIILAALGIMILLAVLELFLR